MLRTLLIRLTWLAVAVLIAFGAAGAAAAMQHPPGTPARAELTWGSDLAAGPALDAAVAELQVLANDVDTLGSTARQSLATVVSGDKDALKLLLAEGTTRVATIDAQARKLQAALGAVPGMDADPGLVVAGDVRRRYDELATTVGMTSGLGDDWSAVTGRALDAATVTGLLQRHDQETVAAAKEGSAAHYKAALLLLDTSDATIAESRALAERLGKAADVSTLNTWLDLNSAYDTALRGLYQSLLDSKGRVTDKVRAAFAAEKDARANLPADTRGLVVIMAEVAQGGLNQAVISIEEARGSLAAVLEDQATPQPSPTLPD